MYRQFCGTDFLIVDSEAVDHIATCFIKADHRNIRTAGTVFQHHLVERTDRGDVPQMSMADIDRHLFAGDEKSKAAMKFCAEAKKIWP